MKTKLTRQDIFATTRWTVVLTAGRRDTARAQQALAELCQSYWWPLYAYVRRKGHAPADAEDLTQGFFARLLALDSLGAVRREKGRFRAFLLASLNHFLADAWDKASAQKRDARQTVSLDAGSAETRYLCEPADRETPESLFERQWALTLLETVVQRLRAEQAAAGKEEQFMALRFALAGERADAPYAQVAARLGVTPEAARVAAHRLRLRYRQLLRDEIAQTVSGPAEVEEELQHLRRVLAR